MSQFFIDFFRDYGKYIVFLHVISAIIWIGGMIVVKFIVAPVMASIQDVKVISVTIYARSYKRGYLDSYGTEFFLYI